MIDKDIVSRAVGVGVQIAVLNRRPLPLTLSQYFKRFAGLLVPFRVTFHDPKSRALTGQSLSWVWHLALKQVAEEDHDRFPMFYAWTLTTHGWEPQGFQSDAQWEPIGRLSIGDYGMSAALRDTVLPDLMAQARTALAIGPRS